MNTKRGSALLIVLGFLSFMVVSAVAFSIYMRSERQPSSALRRSVATRYLVKAALARAISRVDDAIRADPYPGALHDNSHRRQDFSNSPQYGGYYDKWLGRVFMPPEPCEGSGDIPSASEDVQRRLAPVNSSTRQAEETVSVLNLEALGYLPPCLVNDVRFLSRLSWAAKWDYFNFDSGRYAFCAVDVSDFFDLNRLNAATNRNSSAPVSISYLFADNDRTAQGAVARANTFKTLMNNARNQASLRDFPFTSMLDYNLGMGASGQAQDYAPFYNYIGKGNGDFYSGQASSEEGRRRFLNLPFVTDSWAGPCNSAGVLSLADGAQPFDNSIRLDRAPDQYKDIAVIGQKVKDQIGINRNPSRFNFNDAFGVLLYDYLDRNDVPASLSLPCTERTPMVAAIEPQDNFQFATTFSTENTTEGAAGPNAQVKQIQIKKYKLANALFQRPPELRTAIVFPFKRFKDDLNQRYFAKAVMKVFFVPTDTKLNTRPGSTAVNRLRPIEKSDWENGSTMGNGIITLASQWTAVNAKQDITRAEQVLLGSGGFVTIPFGNTPNPDDPAYTLLEIKTETTTKHDANGNAGASETKSYYRSLFSPLNATSMQALLPNDWTEFSGTLPETQYKMQVAVWIRITDQNKQYTVDLVPACLTDDAKLNNMREIPVDATGQAYGFAGTQSGEPLMRFDASAANGLKWTDADMVTYSAAQDLHLSPQALHCVDPRYNYAPECWYAPGNGTAKEASKWYENLKNKSVFGTDGRDPDPFMFVSNQGYLQSVGEFAFLPMVCNMDGGDILPVGGFGGVTEYATEPSGVAGYQKLAWKTFRLYPGDGDSGTDGLYEYNVVDRTRGFFVNPHSPSATIFLGAVANTPWDYLVAGTNDDSCAYANTGESGVKDGVANFPDALKLCFNELSEESHSKIAADKMMDIAAVMQNAFKSGNWTNAYDNLQWSYNAQNESNAKELFGVDTGVYLHSVDRKFLYSFWRNAFSNRQQLFLIFARAESSALAGDGGQLGGRAVALVWRDANTPNGSNDAVEDRSGNGYQRRPHRMRVLFYHQFE